MVSIFDEVVTLVTWNDSTTTEFCKFPNIFWQLLRSKTLKTGNTDDKGTYYLLSRKGHGVCFRGTFWMSHLDIWRNWNPCAKVLIVIVMEMLVNIDYGTWHILIENDWIWLLSIDSIFLIWFCSSTTIAVVVPAPVWFATPSHFPTASSAANCKQIAD